MSKAATIHLSGHLKAFSSGEVEISLPGEYTSVCDALDALWDRYGALHDRILNEQGEIRQHVNIFADGQDVKQSQGLSTKLVEGEIHIFNAVSGG